MCEQSENIYNYTMKRKRVRSTTRQLNMLIDYMSTHTKLANNEFHGLQGRQQKVRQWEALRLALRDYGPDKNISQWEHTWRDLRRNGRNLWTREKSARRTTGHESPYGSSLPKEVALSSSAAQSPAAASCRSASPAASPRASPARSDSSDGVKTLDFSPETSDDNKYSPHDPLSAAATAALRPHQLEHSYECKHRVTPERQDSEHSYFFRSLLPHVARIPERSVLAFRGRVQRLVEQFAYGTASN